VLIIGSNGRLGSIVTRSILRSPSCPLSVISAVHDYSRVSTLSYEVGAEDGKGTIGPAWSEDREAKFEYTNEMRTYNLARLTVREFELLSPLEVSVLVKDVDVVVYCATDFNGNKPRSISSLDVGLLFRAFRNPAKGRVEIEGVRNVLEGITKGKASKEEGRRGYNEFVLVSVAEGCMDDYVTPLGDFLALKKEGEGILKEFPSVNSAIVRMGKYDDNFVDEGRKLDVEEAGKGRDWGGVRKETGKRR